MTRPRRPQLLYVGFFRLPDRNASAHRVLANAKGLRAAGMDVILAEVGDDNGRAGPPERLPDCEGFAHYRLPMKEYPVLDHPRLSTRQVIKLLATLGNPRAIMAYNYPAIPLAQLVLYCHRAGITCAADITEWYGVRELTLGIPKLLKWADTSLRMRVIHPRMDVLVVISKWLEDFYSERNHGILMRIPPLVDSSDSKWHQDSEVTTPGSLRLAYAGSPSRDKERLDLVIAAVIEAARTSKIVLHVIGLSEHQFKCMYAWQGELPSDIITFHGRLSHQESLRWVGACDYTIIIRDQSRLVNAGFPTKFVESITLGTPVLVTSHPDLSEFLSEGRNGRVTDADSLSEDLRRLRSQLAPPVSRRLFDVSRYDAVFHELARALRGP